MPLRHFSDYDRKRAFKLWRRNDGNFTAVSKYEGMPSVPTIIKWAEEEDWEGKLEKAKELVKEAFKDSDDPTLRKIVKDDAFLLLIVGSLRDLALRSMKRRRNKVMPRTTTELVTLLRFIGDIEEKVIPQRKTSTNPEEVGVSVKRVLEGFFGSDEKGKQMASQTVQDIRKRLRVIRGKAGLDEATG